MPSARSTAAAARRAGNAVEHGEHREVLLGGQLGVEVVQLRDDPHAGAGLLRLGGDVDSPSTSIEPDVGRACPVSMRIVVDLPAPLGPSSPRTMPRGTVSVEAVDRRDRAELLDDLVEDDRVSSPLRTAPPRTCAACRAGGRSP